MRATSHVRRLAAAAGLMTFLTTAALAQAPVVTPNGAPAAPAVPTAAPGFGSDLWINAGLFVALAGGALFAVCRGSNRV